MSVASGPKLGGLCRFFVVDFFFILMFEVSESCRAFFFFPARRAPPLKRRYKI